jgi:hypothetical protein
MRENKPNYYNITKWPSNIPNDRKMFQMTIKYTCIFHSIKGPPKFTQIWNFGLKTNHLATLYAEEVAARCS